jgi:hypothetical protein
MHDSHRSLVSEVAPRAPRYAECNVNETGHGSGGAVYTCLCGGQHASGQRAECSHTIGMQTVSTLPYFDRVPSKGAPAPDFWRYNLAQRIGGQWWSTVGSGECKAPGLPTGCTWRLVDTVKVVMAECAEASMNEAVVMVAEGSSCFKKCPQPANTSSTCWIDCFYGTVLGQYGGNLPLANSSHAKDGLSNEQLLAMWAAPFNSDVKSEGGCPAVVK